MIVYFYGTCRLYKILYPYWRQFLKMKKCVYILIFLLSISCQRDKGNINLEHYLQQLHERDLFNGAIIVTENDSVLFSRGFGYADLRLQTPFDTDTPMDTGSITKTFTAFAMIMLVDSNKIDLNTPVQDFIQDFPYESITIRHLLEQTSGIVSDGYVFDNVQKGVLLSNSVFLEFLINDEPKLEFQPGSQFMYNAFNHILLAIIIENISKVSYEDFIRKEIAEPLGMDDWFLRPTRLKGFPNNRAMGYSIEKGTAQVNDSDDFEAFYGDCNLFFSAEDLSKWSRSFISGSIYPKGKLAKELNMKNSSSDFNILHWYKRTDQNKYHFTGDWKGFYTMVYFDMDKKRSIVHLSNVKLSYWLRPALVRNINHYLDIGGIHDWEHPGQLEFTDEEIIGSYRLNKDQVARIGNHSGMLKIHKNNTSVELFKLDSGFYYAPGVDLWVWFSKNGKANLRIHCASIYDLESGFKNSD
ncbi:serine hydrolase domain-containing protein [Ulvibacterium marinum]|uniref:Class A beta-lactamase-related serine hydrolase n=1 Tax=Ulvibacterium marinum TaxID=2419782 RepID=A0A3B0C3A1_9FLAO|nr:serine hydrolase domain-containing protein [Ulvibacterium marinum]RKN80122.1 class A beta-lactamase-related serine hydrolase [Ulvibacterium marinum]